MQGFARKTNYSSFQIPLDSAPLATITPYAASTLPTGWLLCDGSAVSRTTYADLFAIVSTTWGTGDGATTFNLPDLRGAAPAGVGTSTGYTSNETVALGTKYDDQFQDHGISLPQGSSGGLTYRIDTTASANASLNENLGTDLQDNGSGTPRVGLVTKGKTVGVNFIIKALVTYQTQLLISDGSLSVKATGAEVDTGTNDTKFLTPKAIEDSSYCKEAYANTYLSTYKMLYYGAGSHIAARVAGTYVFPPAGGVMAISGTGTLYPQQVFYLRNADYPTVNGKATKLRIVGSVHCNDVAPNATAITFTFGLHPITRPATSGGAGLVIYTAGTVVTGSNGAVVTTPAADSSNNAVGSDFAIPADGWYALCCVTSATIATSAHTHITCELQMRNP